MPVALPPPDGPPDGPPGPTGSQPESGAPGASARERGARPASAAPRGSKRGGPGRVLQSYGSFSGLGLQFAAGLTAFTLIGLWLDRQLGSLPWLLLTGVALGLFSGMWLLIQRSR